MEGQTGIVIEMSSPQTTSEIAEVPVASQTPAKAEKPIGENPQGQNTENPDQPTGVEGTTNSIDGELNEPPPQAEPDPSAAEEELSEEQITKDFDTLWNMLDDKAKKQFIKLLRDDKKEKQFSETSVAFLRAFKLMFAILRLAIPLFEEPKYEFTGADLTLPDAPFEGTDKTYLKNGLPVKSDQSWQDFKQQVAKMNEPMDFSTFMVKVLEANDECSNGITIAKQESGEKTKTKTKTKRELNLLQSFLDNKAKPQSLLKQLFGKFKKPAVRQPASVR